MIQQHTSLPPVIHTRFVPLVQRVFLILAWVGWLAGAGFALGMFAIGLPFRFHPLRTLSSQAAPTLRTDALGPLTTLLRAVFSSQAYPLVVLTQEIVLVI